MSYRYQQIAPPISVAEAQELDRYLLRYAIQVTHLTVRHRLGDGRWVTDTPTADTFKSVTSAGSMGALLAPTLAAAGLVVPVLALPALIVATLADIKALHFLRRRQVPVKAVESEISFDLSGVSAERRGWAEYVLNAYAGAHGWTLTGIQDPQKAGPGRAYGATHAGGPRPWSEQPPALAWPKSRPPRRGKSMRPARSQR